MSARPNPAPSNRLTGLKSWQRMLIFALCWITLGALFVVMDGPLFHPKNLRDWAGLILVTPLIWILLEVAFGFGWEVLSHSAGRYRPIVKVLVIVAIAILFIWSTAHNIATGR